MSEKPAVYVIDDDDAVRQSLNLLLAPLDADVYLFANADEFRAAYEPDRLACLILDLRLPGIQGLDLQADLIGRGEPLPIIIITGHGDVPAAVRAIKAGAMEFLEKPFNPQELLDCVHRALDDAAQMHSRKQRTQEVRTCFARLTPRECEVMNLVVQGRLNKQIATELGVSLKTVEAHRARVMAKTEARSLAELVRMAIDYQEANGDDGHR